MKGNLMMDKITVAGGTGVVGAQLVRELLRAGSPVRVLTRDPESANKVFDNSRVEVIGVDFDDANTLHAAFHGSKRAFLCMGITDRQVQDEIALIDAACGCGVVHLVKLSAGGASGKNKNNVLRWHSKIDAYLAAKKVAWTMLRPSIYVQTILGFATRLVPSGQWGGTAGEGLVSLIDVRDVAAAASEILRGDPRLHCDKIYNITGPSAVSMHDVARLIAARIGRPVDYQDRTAAEQRVIYASLGLPPIDVDVLLGFDDLTREGVFAKPTSQVFDLSGKAARSVSAWIDENVDKFARSVRAA
jgi:uncharacterized protein YbjT (DUF2867 family)